MVKRFVDYMKELKDIPQIWTSVDEKKLLYDLGMTVKGNILEIGCGFGFNLVLLSKIFGDRQVDYSVYGIDLFDIQKDMWSAMMYQGYRKKMGFKDGMDPFEFVSRYVCVSDREVLFRGSSLDLANMWKSPLHLLIIDGNHKFRFVSSDLRNFEKWVSNGGTILLHDYIGKYKGVAKALTEFLNKRKNYKLMRIVDRYAVVKKYDV